MTLADRGVFDSYFATLAEPISDYTFSQFYTWRNSLRILWKEIGGNLCVFANGAGDLTLLAPPIGDEARGARALDEACEMMDEYNAAKGVVERSRVEYVSEELMRRIVRPGVEVRPLGMDYVYDVRRMIDLAGGDLARSDLNHWTRPARSLAGGQWARTVPFFTRRSMSMSRQGSPKNCTTETGATGNLPSRSFPSSFGRLVPTTAGIAFL